MSRDRLAERRRAREDAQQQQQQQQGNEYGHGHADPLQHGYGYQQDGYASVSPPAAFGYGAYGHGESAGPQYYSTTMPYSGDAGRASEGSVTGGPPPSYNNGGSDGRRRRRPSEGDRDTRQGSTGRPATQRTRSGDDRQQPRREGTRQPSYGNREDQSAYYENSNQSSAALNSRSHKQQQPYGNFDQEPPRRSRKGSSSNDQSSDMYEIPTLPKGSRQRQQRQPMEPQSPPYSSVAPGSSGPSPGFGGGSATHVTSDAPEIDMNAFFEELDSVRDSMREMEQYITYIEQLHSRSMSGTRSDDVAGELESANDGMRKLTNSLRKRVKALQETTRIRTHGPVEQERLVRKTQTEGLKNKFMKMLQNYQNMEMKQRDRSRQRIERQYLIAKPNASAEEVRLAVESGQDVQVFAQALRQSNRMGNAQSVLNEVQSRHEAIKQIEKTLVELFQMFQDMSQLVEEQDEQIIMIEEKAEEAVKDIEAGHTGIVQAVGSAKKARKKRKCCCIISLILILILGGVLAYLIVKVILPKINENKDNAEKEKETKTVVQSAGTRTQQAAVNTNTNGNANANAGTATGVAATTSRALRVRDLLALPAYPTGTGSPVVAAYTYMVRG